MQSVNNTNILKTEGTHKKYLIFNHCNRLRCQKKDVNDYNNKDKPASNELLFSLLMIYNLL